MARGRPAKPQPAANAAGVRLPPLRQVYRSVMKIENLLYWIQGAVEMAGIVELSEVQVECLRRHVELAIVHDVDAPAPLREFAAWLHGGIKMVGPGPMDQSRFSVLRERVHAMFEHVIDPSLGESEAVEALKDVHDGTTPGAGSDRTDEKRERMAKALADAVKNPIPVPMPKGPWSGGHGGPRVMC